MGRKAHSIIRTGKPYPLTEGQYHVLCDQDLGICRACGEERENCEPDARDYPCRACGQMEVYGVEELLAREEIRIK